MSPNMIGGLRIFAAPHLVIRKEIHRKPRKWARRVMYQRSREYDFKFADAPSREVIRIGDALYMHPAMIEEVNRAIGAYT